MEQLCIENTLQLDRYSDHSKGVRAVDITQLAGERERQVTTLKRGERDDNTQLGRERHTFKRGRVA